MSAISAVSVPASYTPKPAPTPSPVIVPVDGDSDQISFPALPSDKTGQLLSLTA